MAKAFEIDFPRQAILQTLNQEHIKNPYFIGGANQVAITSFYEQLATDEEVNRYVEVVRDLTNQQNRAGLIANGVIIAPSNPTITNLNQCTIIPLDFTLNIRCTLEDRDLVKEAFNNVVTILKGRKQDICEFDNGKLFMVGTLGNNINGKPLIRNGDFIGVLPNTTPSISVNTFITNRQNELIALGFESDVLIGVGSYLHYEEQSSGQLKVAILTNDNGWVEQEESSSYPNIIFPPEHNSFTKWKLSMSFDSFRCSEPRTLNSKDYCELSFGGSATITSDGVLLGNEMVKMSLKKLGAYTSDGLDTTLADINETWLEPLELPSGNNADTIANQLISNNFITNSHTNSLALSRQYTFIVDTKILMIKELYKYARFGAQTYTTPNMLYQLAEVYSSWGNVDIYYNKAKIIESIDIENTESDTMTIILPMQIQGDNN